MTWQLQAAKQRFSEVVERARREGPQVVTNHGKEAVVVVSVEEYRRLRGEEPSLVDFIRSAPSFDLLEGERAQDRRRDVVLWLPPRYERGLRDPPRSRPERRRVGRPSRRCRT
jgi:antitoxin Phd